MMLDPDQLALRFANHVGKLFDRLDAAYEKIELKEYCAALIAARQLILGLVALHKGQADADTGSAVRKFSAAFTPSKDAAHRGEAGSGSARSNESATVAEPTSWADADSAGDADGELSADGNGDPGGMESRGFRGH